MSSVDSYRRLPWFVRRKVFSPEKIHFLRYPGQRILMPSEEEQDPDEPAPLPDYEDGVDRSLIRWTLSLTPAERLAFL